MDEFRARLAEFGLYPENIIVSDKIQRFSVKGSKDKSGWYFFQNLGDSSYGAFGNWSVGLSETYTRFSKSRSDQEVKEIKKQIEETKKQSEILRKEEAEKVALKAKSIWDSIKEGNHPYLDRKRIRPNGSRVFKNSLVIPVWKNKKIISLQFIDDNGKRFMSGGDVSGGAYVIRGDKKNIVLCEGFSTGASIHEATGYQVFVCFNAGNLPKVAPKVKELFPDSEITVACDNDKYKEKNTGVEFGTMAARFIGAEIVIPEFKDESTKPTDFNDLAILEGYEEVRKRIIPEKVMMKNQIKEWCEKFNGNFSSNEIFNYFQITNKSQKNVVDDILVELCDENIIQKDPRKRSQFRVVDSEIKTMVVERAERSSGVDIILPFGLSEHVIIEARNIIIVAGESNAGKTAILMTNMMENIYKSNQFSHPVYISSEMSQSEFSNRALLLMDDPYMWNQAEIIDKSNNFNDAISRGRGDKLTYIDLLEVNEETSFSDMESNLKKIRDSLNKGVSVIAMQKSTGQKFARGGEGTLSKSRLYISLHHCYKGEKGIVNMAVIEKCKMVRPGCKNPEGKKLFYQIKENGGVIAITPWDYVKDLESTLSYIKRRNPEAGNTYKEISFTNEYNGYSNDGGY